MTPTDLVSRPKGQWKQSTGKWRRSTKDLVGRSTAVWDNSKYNYHQSTMEMWHKSADTWNNSKDRCQQSAKSVLYRSVLRWNQTADQLHQVARIEDSNERTTQEPTELQVSPPSSRLSQSSQSRFYSQLSNSPQSTNQSPNTAAELPAPPKSISPSIKRSSLSPEQQIIEFYEALIPVKSLVAQTKKTRDDKQKSLAEIELEWVNSTISETEHAVDNLFAFIGPFWINQCKETQVSSQDCKSWSRRNYQRAMERKSHMLLCYSKVETVLGHLKSLQAVSSPKDGIIVASSRSLSVASITTELSCDTKAVPVFELRSLPPVPTIIVTQYDGDRVDGTSPVAGTPPPSYEASRMDNTEQLR
ncbi:hypothetical protein N7457_009290 [Penicillium paradoxum]|uniref:uncharacterized protein n=1 Tax=Penicillium paradoxum TaxID=176176 RepID=UPI00254989D2|nr:uncharacterized protein N7457_009290 [Penicillium paradoxum]KAJ5774394.1 hypothetical protein N7457_009290 [Penicillium paradoxum]